MHIAILETNRSCRHFIASLMKWAQHTSSVTNNRGNFLIAVQTKQPSVAIVDILPEDRGQLLEIEIILKALTLSPHLKVIAVSTSETTLARAKYLLPKGVKFLLKPFHIQDLLGEVNSANSHIYTDSSGQLSNTSSMYNTECGGSHQSPQLDAFAE